MPESTMERIYEGSVKNVYRNRQEHKVHYFEFTDDYSIFDWGKMPDTIANKGKALSILGGTFFRQLGKPESWQLLPQAEALQPFDRQFVQSLFATETYQQLKTSGLHHHFLGWVDANDQPVGVDQLTDLCEAPLMKVRSIEITRPKAFSVDHHTLYHYGQADTLHAEAFLVPLEVVFRFGMPEGSSLKARLEKNPHYASELGLSAAPQENVMFERPIIEFFTKLEPSDRFLTVQEAYLISGLNEEQFKTLYETTLLLSLWLYNAFAEKGIALWDGKFEFAWTSDGLMLVDSIGPDELRLKYDGVHLSKEVIRQFYRGSSWDQALSRAKAEALSQPGLDWHALCVNQYREQPQPLSTEQKQLADNLYAALTNQYLGEAILPARMTFEEVIAGLREKQPIGAH